jgi:hypothetical protein
MTDRDSFEDQYYGQMLGSVHDAIKDRNNGRDAAHEGDLELAVDLLESSAAKLKGLAGYEREEYATLARYAAYTAAIGGEDGYYRVGGLAREAQNLLVSNGYFLPEELEGTDLKADQYEIILGPELVGALLVSADSNNQDTLEMAHVEVERLLSLAQYSEDREKMLFVTTEMTSEERAATVKKHVARAELVSKMLAEPDLGARRRMAVEGNLFNKVDPKS